MKLNKTIGWLILLVAGCATPKNSTPLIQPPPLPPIPAASKSPSIPKTFESFATLNAETPKLEPSGAWKGPEIRKLGFGTQTVFWMDEMPPAGVLKISSDLKTWRDVRKPEGEFSSWQIVVGLNVSTEAMEISIGKPVELHFFRNAPKAQFFKYENDD